MSLQRGLLLLIIAMLENLIPFTRWVTPTNVPKRFTTQMYLYMLPLSARRSADAAAAGAPKGETLIPTPTPDGGLEHTAARFDDAAAWLAKARAGEVILFPPQFFLLTLVAKFCTGAPSASGGDATKHYQAQRDALREFLSKTPTSQLDHWTCAVPWAEKVISPVLLTMRQSDGRTVLGLERPGQDLEKLPEGQRRGGDFERVVLVRFAKDGPRELEVRGRQEILAEEREANNASKL